MPDAEAEVESLFATYEPARAALGRALRARLRARLPGLTEIVYMYENQRALVISYSPSERGYEGVLSFALRPDSLHLYFTKGALLGKADPAGLLQGGKGVRHIVLGSIGEFDRPEIEALIAAALKVAKVRVDPAAKGAVILKAESQRKRAARTATAKRPAAAPRKAGTRR